MAHTRQWTHQQQSTQNVPKGTLKDNNFLSIKDWLNQNKSAKILLTHLTQSVHTLWLSAISVDTPGRLIPSLTQGRTTFQGMTLHFTKINLFIYFHI